MDAGNKPLSGFRVLELSNYVAAPSCGRLLADWGADVIKVDGPSGDVMRCYGSVMMMPASETENPLWDMLNNRKRGITIDLKSPDGKALFVKLLEKADVFLTNTRSAALKKMGLDYESLRERFPRLVYALITGFGETGPDAELPGFDVVAFWARSGFLLDLVKPDEYPIYSPAAFGDVSVGATLFGGICAALLNREKTGKGDKISISLYGSAIWFACFLILSTQEQYGNKYPKLRLEGNPLAIPYKCSDDEWIMLALIDIDRSWKPFCHAVNRAELIEDKRFRTRTDLLDHREELISILDQVFLTRSSAEWLKVFREGNLVAEKLNHFSDVTKDPQAWANEFLMKKTFSNGKEGILPCPPLKSLNLGKSSLDRGPLAGEHTQEILEELGYSPDQIDKIKKSKSILAG